MRILLGIDLRIDGHEWLVHQSVAFAERVSGRIDLVFAAGNEDQAQRQERQRQLEDILQTLPEEVRGTAAILDGEAVEALVAMTDAVDILVVGPREPGALTRWIYGPVAARVVNMFMIHIARREGGGIDFLDGQYAVTIAVNLVDLVFDLQATEGDLQRW